MRVRPAQRGQVKLGVLASADEGGLAVELALDFLDIAIGAGEQAGDVSRGCIGSFPPGLPVQVRRAQPDLVVADGFSSPVEVRRCSGRAGTPPPWHAKGMSVPEEWIEALAYENLPKTSRPPQALAA